MPLPGKVSFELDPGAQPRQEEDDGEKDRVLLLVKALRRFRACYVQLVRRAGTTNIVHCHVNSFACPGGVLSQCIDCNAKVVPGQGHR